MEGDKYATSARITAVSGANPGPRSGLRYTLSVNMRGNNVGVFTNVPPAGPGPADEWDVDAHPVGTEILCTVEEYPGRLVVKAWTREERAAGSC